MTPGGEAPTASSPDPVRALGQRLQQSGYLETSLPEALASEGPLATLAALFGLGVAVPRAAVPDAAALEAEGLLAREGDDVRARLRISVWNGLLMAHDSGGGPRPDVVMEPRESAQTLAHLTVRRPGQTVLDLGCGCGPHALLAARARGARRGDGHQPAGHAAHAAQRPAQRCGRRRRDARRRPLRAGGRRALRARGLEPALRHLARRRPAVPRQRPRAGRAVPSHRRRRRRAPRGGRRRERALQLGLERGRRPVGPAARVAGGHRLRRLRRQLGPRGRRRLRGALDRAVGGRGGAARAGGGDRALGPLLLRGRHRGDLVRGARAPAALGRGQLVRRARRLAPAAPAGQRAARADLRGPGLARGPARRRAARPRARPRGAAPADARPGVARRGLRARRHPAHARGRHRRRRRRRPVHRAGAAGARRPAAARGRRAPSPPRRASRRRGSPQESLPCLRRLYGRGFLFLNS